MCLVNRSSHSLLQGAYFDEDTSLDKHVSNTCKACFFHLRNVISKLYSANSLLYGLPTSVYRSPTKYPECCGPHYYPYQGIWPHQACPSLSVDLLSPARFFDCLHWPRALEQAKPVLKHLHWLPVSQRIITVRCYFWPIKRFMAKLLVYYWSPMHQLGILDIFL